MSKVMEILKESIDAKSYEKEKQSVIRDYEYEQAQTGYHKIGADVSY